VMLPPEVLPLPDLRATLARAAANVVFGWLRERRSRGLTAVEERLRTAGKEAETPDKAVWTEAGVQALAAVLEAGQEPERAGGSATQQPFAPPVRVVLPTELHPATLGERHWQELVLRFGASPAEVVARLEAESAESRLERGRRADLMVPTNRVRAAE